MQNLKLLFLLVNAFWMIIYLYVNLQSIESSLYILPTILLIISFFTYFSKYDSKPKDKDTDNS